MIDICTRGNDDLLSRINGSALFLVDGFDLPLGLIFWGRCDGLYASVLLRIGAIVLGKRQQCSQQELNIDDPVVRGVESLPIVRQIFERVFLLNLVLVI